MKKNFIYNCTYQVLSLIIPIITAPYLSRTLGVEAIGIFSYTYANVTFFTILAVMGTTTYGQREIAFVRDDKRKLSNTFWEIFLLRLLLVMIILPIFIFYIFFSVQYKKLYIVLGMNILNVVFDITWFYQGIEEFKKIVLRNIIVKILNVVSIILFIKNENDILIYAAIYCGYMIVGNMSTWIGISQRICYPDKVNPLCHFKQVLLLFIPTVAMQVYTVLDKAMIGWFTKSEYENGCYEQAEKISRLAVTVVAALATVLAPRVANKYEKYSRGECESSEYKELLIKGIRVAVALALPMMLGLIAVTPLFVPVFFGEGYDKVIILLPVFSFLVLFVGLANIIGIAYLIPTKRHNIYTIAVSVSAVINLGINIVLIPRYMSLGASIASIIAECVGVGIQFGYCVNKGEIKVKTLLSHCWKYVVAASVMFGILLLCRGKFPYNWVSLCEIIIIGMSVYGLSLLVLRDELIVKNICLICKKKCENRERKKS